MPNLAARSNPISQQVMKPLSKKQAVTHADFVAAMERASAVVPRDRLDALAAATVEEIARVSYGKRAACAWSGGKDSQVLRCLAECANIRNSVLVLTAGLEYPGFVTWAMAHAPVGLHIVTAPQTLPWLAAHPAYLFPTDSRIAARWYHAVQHRGQERYVREHGVDILLTGRRVLDGNYVGGMDGIYTARGVTRYAPIRRWLHEELFAFIAQYNIPLPPCYSWPNGWIEGTHPWPLRQYDGSVENAWRAIYCIDATIVREAAAYLPSAAAYLRGVEP